MANMWFKFYGAEYLSDPKIERLNPLERSCWVTLLCLASNSTEEGFIEFLTVESLLNKSGVQFDPYNPELWESSLSVLKKFESMKMIDLGDNGTITVLNWSKRQERNLTVSERVAKHRAKKKECNENVTKDVTNVTLEENRIEENRNNIYTSSFGDFWKIYPKKVGKKKAFVQWKKLNEEDIVKAMADVPNRKLDDKWVNGYIKDAERYLSHRQFEDEIIKPKGGAYKNKTSNTAELLKAKLKK